MRDSTRAVHAGKPPAIDGRPFLDGPASGGFLAGAFGVAGPFLHLVDPAVPLADGNRRDSYIHDPAREIEPFPAAIGAHSGTVAQPRCPVLLPRK